MLALPSCGLLVVVAAVADGADEVADGAELLADLDDGDLLGTFGRMKGDRGSSGGSSGGGGSGIPAAAVDSFDCSSTASCSSSVVDTVNDEEESSCSFMAAATLSAAVAVAASEATTGDSKKALPIVGSMQQLLSLLPLLSLSSSNNGNEPPKKEVRSVDRLRLLRESGDSRMPLLVVRMALPSSSVHELCSSGCRLCTMSSWHEKEERKNTAAFVMFGRSIACWLCCAASSCNVDVA